MFEKMLIDADEPDSWQPISEETARKELADFYKDVDEVINYLKFGGTARAYWALYRWTPGETQS